MRTLDRFSALLSERGDMSLNRSISAYRAMYWVMSKVSSARLSGALGARMLESPDAKVQGQEMRVVVGVCLERVVGGLGFA